LHHPPSFSCMPAYSLSFHILFSYHFSLFFYIIPLIT
jgi:hypothetical protein